MIIYEEFIVSCSLSFQYCLLFGTYTLILKHHILETTALIFHILIYYKIAVHSLTMGSNVD